MPWAHWRLTGRGLESRIKKMLFNDSRIREEDGEIGENRDGKDRFLLGTATGRMTEMKDQESTVWAVQIRLD
ncbi:hypothetical protein GOBAR_AA26917 [Gossypium barbadense]|uniref:Uncharacterized protein n=1 Tax=Gossypium barbadense TaxID=3634 RepID=A0A2P5WRN0_GOSBA|nr:hypothetical protein GOBAR_AA26917 [Gossypium barbadense]